MNPLRLLREIHCSVLALDAQGNRIERDLGKIMAGQQELQTAIDALKASEDALIERVNANAQAAADRATQLQATIDALKAQNAPELQPQIDALTALKQEADAAAQAPAPAPADTGTPAP